MYDLDLVGYSDSLEKYGFAFLHKGVSISAAQDVFVDPDGEVYVADLEGLESDPHKTSIAHVSVTS